VPFLFVSGKSVGSLNCGCPTLQIHCLLQYTPPGECCPRCAASCEPTGEIFYDDNGKLLLWKPSPCEFCKCVDGKPECTIQDCAFPYCDNYVGVKGICCPICPPGNCNPKDEVFYENDQLSWRLNPCTQCYCINGEPLCQVERCVPPLGVCLHPVIPEG